MFAPKSLWGFPGGTSGKEPACQCRRRETWVQSLGKEDPLEEEMGNPLHWRIPWTDEPGGLQSIGSQRVGQDWIDLAHMHLCLCGLVESGLWVNSSPGCLDCHNLSFCCWNLRFFNFLYLDIWIKETNFPTGNYVRGKLIGCFVRKISIYSRYIFYPPCLYKCRVYWDLQPKIYCSNEITSIKCKNFIYVSFYSKDKRRYFCRNIFLYS